MSLLAKCHFQFVFGFYSRKMQFLVLAILLAAPVRGINVDTKLDFQREKDDRPKLLEKLYVVQKRDDDFDKIGVVCVSGGCNTTDAKGTADTISADVVVAVKTNLNVNQNKNKSTEEIPDVPIVIGYGGITDNPNSRINPEDNALNPHHIVITNLEDTFQDIPSLVVTPTLGIDIAPPYIVRDDFKNKHWYPRTQQNNYNPLGNVGRPDWKTSGAPWNNRNNGYNGYNRNYYHVKRPATPPTWTTACNCHNHGWRPTTPSYQPIQHPGTQINDKLAPLN